MYGSHKFFLIPVAACTLHLAASRAAAQFDNIWTANAATATNWNDDSNWSQGGVPAIDPFQEVGVINNGGTAFVQDTPPDVGGIILGRVAGGSGDNSGTLEIRSGGNLTAISGINNTGALIVGQDATGTLNVLAGGQLTAASIQSSGASSSINLSGNAQLISTGSMSLNAVTDIAGQSANLSTATAMSFGAGGRLQLEINGSTAPLIKAGTGVSLGGALELDFGGTPSPGSTWNLFDAGAIVGQFAQISLANGSLGTGQRFRVRAVADGSSMNGVFGQLVLEQLLVLEINRDTGAMMIVNPSASTPIALDTYAITSSNGSFNTANGAWTSLTDQAEPGWIEANPKPTQLAELGTSGDTTINGGSQLSLGTPWNPQFTQLGQNREDVVFRYTSPDGEVITAPVVYTGVAVNDIALIVDPATGEAQLRNGSTFSVDIEGYSIRSQSMSLNPANWESLQENGDASDWLEANPTNAALSELRTAGVETLSGNRAFDLGVAFDPGGTQDLVFEYLIAGQSQPTLGKVLYQAIPPIVDGLIGDYNDDGVVDAADYTVWRDHLGSNALLPNDSTPGSVTPEDYTAWKNNFGATGDGGALAVATVPEPSASLLTIVGLGVGAAFRSCTKSGKRSAARRKG